MVQLAVLPDATAAPGGASLKALNEAIARLVAVLPLGMRELAVAIARLGAATADGVCQDWEAVAARLQEAATDEASVAVSLSEETRAAVRALAGGMRALTEIGAQYGGVPADLVRRMPALAELQRRVAAERSTWYVPRAAEAEDDGGGEDGAARAAEPCVVDYVRLLFDLLATARLDNTAFIWFLFWAGAPDLAFAPPFPLRVALIVHDPAWSERTAFRVCGRTASPNREMSTVYVLKRDTAIMNDADMRECTREFARVSIFTFAAAALDYETRASVALQETVQLSVGGGGASADRDPTAAAAEVTGAGGFRVPAALTRLTGETSAAGAECGGGDASLSSRASDASSGVCACGARSAAHSTSTATSCAHCRSYAASQSSSSSAAPQSATTASVMGNLNCSQPWAGTDSSSYGSGATQPGGSPGGTPQPANFLWTIVKAIVGIIVVLFIIWLIVCAFRWLRQRRARAGLGAACAGGVAPLVGAAPAMGGCRAPGMKAPVAVVASPVACADAMAEAPAYAEAACATAQSDGFRNVLNIEHRGGGAGCAQLDNVFAN